MPRHIKELRDNDPFPVKPETNEYEALSFLVRNREFGFTPSEIAERTTIPEASASKTMVRLFEKGLVKRSQGAYFVDPAEADELKDRLNSIDAAARLHQSTSNDDVYGEAGWEDKISSIDPNQDQDRQSGETTSTSTEAANLVDRLASDESSD